MKVRPALVTVELPGSEPEKAPHTARGRGPDARARRGAKLAKAIAYPYVAEPIRVLAPKSSWPFALKTPLASPKPEKLTQAKPPIKALPIQVPPPAGHTEPPIKALPIQVPPPAGRTEPPLAPPSAAPEAIHPSLASTVDASYTEPSAQAAPPPQQETPLLDSMPAANEATTPQPATTLLDSMPAAREATTPQPETTILDSMRAPGEATTPQPETTLLEPVPADEVAPPQPDPPAEPLPATVEVPPPADPQPATFGAAADGGKAPEPSLDERPSRARIVERLWEDPIREELEVNLGTTTDSNLYVDVDLRVANGGVFVATYQALPPGTHVALHITLAGGVATSAHGRVTLKRESLEAFGDPAPGVCVAFELLSNEALALLEQFASIRTPWLIEDE